MQIQRGVTYFLAHQGLKSGGTDVLTVILASTALLSVREHLILLLFLFMIYMTYDI